MIIHLCHAHYLKGREEAGREVGVALLADDLDHVVHPDGGVRKQAQGVGVTRPLGDVDGNGRPEMLNGRVDFEHG